MMMKPVSMWVRRSFHLLFALSFAGAWLTAESERGRLWHVYFGYAMAALLMGRLLLGVVGPRALGLGVLARRVGAVPGWLHGVAEGWRAGSLTQVAWRQGLYLALGVAVAALLAVAAPLLLSGWAVYEEWVPAVAEHALAELHEGLGEFALALVVIHVALVLAVRLGTFVRRR
jgi:cytochrome b